MSRKHHQSKFKSQKAKTVAGSNYTPVQSSSLTVKKEEPKKTTTQTWSKYNYSKYVPCHGITEIYENFFLMGGSDEKEFIQKYNPDVIVPLAGAQGRVYEYGFKGDIYYFPCPDYGTLPDDILNKLVLKIVAGLTYGLKIGMYCMGGHGRTGYVAAAVLGVLGIEDPINYLWTKYCSKAIESRAQLLAVAEYIGKPELYDKYKSKIIDFTYGFSKGSYGYGGWSDWGYTGAVSTPKKSKHTTYAYGWDDDYDDGYGSIIGDHFSKETYWDELIQRAANDTTSAKVAEDEDDFDDEDIFNIPVEDLDDLDETIAWRKAQEGRVLTPTEIKMLQDDPMWACSEMTLERLHGDELMEAFEYLKDVYGIG